MPPAIPHLPQPPSHAARAGRRPRAMTEHVPVLAPELVSLLAPEPGQTAVDCTFGAGGHARRVAAQLGPDGTLIGIDRDPAAEARFAEFAAEAPCRTRFIGADFAAGLRALRGEGIRPEMIYMDLGMSSMQVDAWERGFSYAYDAPLDMRMDTRQELRRRRPRQRVAGGADRPGAAPLRRGALRRRHRPRDRPPPPAAAPPPSWSPRSRPGCRPRPASAPATRPSAASRRSGSPSTASSTRSSEALPLAWELLAVGGRFGAISFHSLEDRPVKQFLAAKARGCICPPELPVCVCGHEPEAELLTRRAVSPGPGRGRGQPALALGPPARRAQARRGRAGRGGRLMAVAAPARRTAPRPAPPPSRTRAAAPQSRPGSRPHAPAPKAAPRRAAAAAPQTAPAAPRAAPARRPGPRPRSAPGRKPQRAPPAAS